MVKSKVGSLSSADATEEKGDDHVVDDVADDLKLQQVMSPSALSYLSGVMKTHIEKCNSETIFVDYELVYMSTMSIWGLDEVYAPDQSGKYWHPRVQAIATGRLLNSLAPSMLAVVRGSDMAKAPPHILWGRLKAHFHGSSDFEITDLLTQMQTVQQGSLTLTAYLDKINTLAGRLAALGEKYAVQPQNEIIIMLQGLNPRYKDAVEQLWGPSGLPSYDTACQYLKNWHRRRYNCPPNEDVGDAAPSGSAMFSGQRCGWRQATELQQVRKAWKPQCCM